MIHEESFGDQLEREKREAAIEAAGNARDRLGFVITALKDLEIEYDHKKFIQQLIKRTRSLWDTVDILAISLNKGE